jgi:acyl-CoA thioester hydrolase
MEYTSNTKIYHSDTDCYNVVWHGSYIKWLEQGRVELSEKIGIKFAELDKLNILMPVVDLCIRYKSPAKLFDELQVKTTLKELKKTSVTFEHEIKRISDNTIILTATSVIVTTDKHSGKLFRIMPAYLYDKYSKVLK